MRALGERGVHGALLRALLLGAHLDALGEQRRAALLPQPEVGREAVHHDQHVALLRRADRARGVHREHALRRRSGAQHHRALERAIRAQRLHGRPLRLGGRLSRRGVSRAHKDGLEPPGQRGLRGEYAACEGTASRLLGQRVGAKDRHRLSAADGRERVHRDDAGVHALSDGLALRLRHGLVEEGDPARHGRGRFDRLLNRPAQVVEDAAPGLVRRPLHRELLARVLHTLLARGGVTLDRRGKIEAAALHDQHALATALEAHQFAQFGSALHDAWLYAHQLVRR